MAPASLAKRYTQSRNLSEIEWIVTRGLLCQTESQTAARIATSWLRHQPSGRSGRSVSLDRFCLVGLVHFIKIEPKEDAPL